ncbi:ABC transporter substrate-binding protein [Rhizohabitans arisaemae]|uniref:ABC transporter substrate-binding protein n=1 Tax=Rhizohabitans arisaemae TaxID=2720610 RepID=UPI0024B0FD4C|nr:ABC transporter substrate-binding protein [Rhizohabitans arisaemae]
MTSSMNRRRFLRAAGLAGGGLALGSCGAVGLADSGPQLVFTEPRTKLSGSLTILMWSHLINRHNEWFARFAQDWGRRVGVTVRVEQVSADELPGRIAAQLQAGRGHDLIQGIGPLSQYEPVVHDLKDVVQEANRRWGAQRELCRKSGFNPRSGRHYAFCPGWSPDPGNHRSSHWSAVGLTGGPTTWDELLEGGARIKQSAGVRLGLGLAPEIDSGMAARALLWSYGAAEQDEEERVTLYGDAAVDAVEFMATLYRRTMTDEVFTWNATSNNRGLTGGDLSYIMNSITAWRTAQSVNPEVAKDVFFLPALRGPQKAFAAPHLVYSWIVPKYSQAVDTAKEFLLHHTANSPAAVYNSELCDLPAWPSLVPRLAEWLDRDPFGAKPAGKLALLKSASDWTVNLGHPGPANPAIGEVFSLHLLPKMMARVARGQETAKVAVLDTDRQMRKIFESWRSRGLVGG